MSELLASLHDLLSCICTRFAMIKRSNDVQLAFEIPLLYNACNCSAATIVKEI